MIRVVRAPAYATVQDEGRTGFRSSGVPRAGAMDLQTLRTLNAMLGNPRGLAAIEWAVSAGEIQFEAESVFAIGGADTAIGHRGREIEAWRAHRASVGDVITISAPRRGRFLYVAVAGGIDTRLVMKSRSTYLPGAFGGHEGRLLKSGDVLRIGSTKRRNRPYVNDALPEDLRPKPGGGVIRYIPRDSPFEQSGFTISTACDRTGYRLDTSASIDGGSITSEPVCPGVIQVPPSGQPIVLMADAPTVGGYRVAGAVISTDMSSLAQRAPGEEVRLITCSLADAYTELGREADRIASVEHWAGIR